MVDNFFNGSPWSIGLKRYIRAGESNDLELSILPLRVDSPIFLEDAVRKKLPATGQVEALQSIEVVPQYQLIINTRP